MMGLDGIRTHKILLLIWLFSLSPFAAALDAPDGIVGATTVNAFQAKQLFDRGALFIDVRSQADWEIGRIAGAQHLDLQSTFGELYHNKSIARNTPLVIYCNSDACLRSAYASAVTVHWGFSQVFYFRSGFFAWMLQDFPLDMGLITALDQPLVTASRRIKSSQPH